MERNIVYTRVYSNVLVGEILTQRILYMWDDSRVTHVQTSAEVHNNLYNDSFEAGKKKS